MTVPTHNLYDFIHQVTENEYFIMYFYPFGSKGIKNIITYYPDDPRDIGKYFPNTIYSQKTLPGTVYDYVPRIICYDQEPLNYELYTDKNIDYEFLKWRQQGWPGLSNLNLRWADPGNWQSQWILLHSEKNSLQVQKYLNTGQYQEAYWWSHAMLALDWYRFAEHDTRLQPSQDIHKLFLIYCRDTTGSRQYRQQFIDMLDSDLQNASQIGSLDSQPASSDLSAVYNVDDFNSTAISVVLETVFDERIHLTEKTLRAIACGHPFILAGGPGSLDYLRSYGFQTFDGLIDESYDQEQDSNTRLALIVKEMTRLNNLSVVDKQQLISKLQPIVNHNKNLFFSQDFFNNVKQELYDNVTHAHRRCANKVDWKHCWTIISNRKKSKHGKSMPRMRLLWVTLLRHLKKGGTLEDYVPPWEK
jgi:hypothetical protein